MPQELRRKAWGGGGNGGFRISAGDGGFGISAGVSPGDQGTILAGAAIAFGGSDGEGNTAGAVEISSTGRSIKTVGDRSQGILAQSVGGGGGNGGFSIAAGISQGGPLSLSLGGNGGNGGTVNLTNSSIISTGVWENFSGNDAAGIQAQSIGGGGGNSGFSIAGGLAPGAGLGLSFGSTGGAAGNADTVEITDTGAMIMTAGDRSIGIQAQSIGGGGGHGGFSIGAGLGSAAELSVSLGADGSSGNGDAISVTSSSSIRTFGNDSTGILAQSIGAGGGFGGVNLYGPSGGASTDVSLGASGAGSGDGGDVTVVATGKQIVTSGERSSGIVAQSIGGGGGIGWISAPGSAQTNSATLTLGGNNTTGDGGQITLQNSSNISVSAVGAYGILAQSIGGGGGLGSADTGLLALDSTSNVSLGGANSTYGDAGQINITNTGSISTGATGGYGIIAQSIGGGGGLAGYSGRVGINGINLTMPSGDGTSHGIGGNVLLSNSASISTGGIGAIGIVAQSIGGGGGLNLASGNAGSAGGTGRGGNITVTNSGDVSTTGAYAHGIFAQSSAGSPGGPVTGETVTVDNSGTVQVSGAGSSAIYAVSTVTGDTVGAGQISITNESSGILRGASDGTAPIRLSGGSNNIVVNSGLISSAGEPVSGTYATFNQSGQLQCNTLTINTGLFNQTGGINRVNGQLTLESQGGGTGNYNLSGGSLTVETLKIGAGSSFNNSGGTLSYQHLVHNGNFSSDLINTGTPSGSGIITGNVTNLGTINPGNSPGVLTVAGSYTQGASGVHIVEVASASSYDKLVVTGGAANLAGAIAPTSYGGFKPRGNQLFPGVVTATGGINGTFSAIANQQFTPTLSWQTSYNPDSVDLWVKRSYTNAGLTLNGNQQAVGSLLDGFAGVTSGDMDRVLNAIDYLPNSATVRDAFNQISPEKAGALTDIGFLAANFQMRNLATRTTNLRFLQGEFGGSSLNGGRFGLSASKMDMIMLAYNGGSVSNLFSGSKELQFSDSRWGFFVDGGASFGKQYTTANQTGYDFTLGGFTVGADFRLRDNLLLGLAAGYSNTSSRFFGSGGRVDTNTVPLNAYVAYFPGALYAYGSIGYALNMYDLNRGINFGGIARTASSSTTGDQFNLYGETGYDLKLSRIIVTPSATLAYSALWVGGFNEKGADALNLKVGSQSADSLQTGIGGKITLPLKVCSAKVIPQFYAFYQHEFSNGSRSINANLSQGGSPFSFQTDAAKRDYAPYFALIERPEHPFFFGFFRPIRVKL